MADASQVFPLPDGVDLVEAAAVPGRVPDRLVCLRAGGGGRGRPGRRDRGGRRRRLGAAPGPAGEAREDDRARRLGAPRCRSAGSSAPREVGTYESAEALIERAFGGRADVVVDAIGGRIFRRLWRRLGPAGRYVLYGFAAASGASGVAKLTAARELLAMGLFSPYSFVQSCRTLIGFNLSLLPDRTGELQRAAARSLRALEGRDASARFSARDFLRASSRRAPRARRAGARPGRSSSR